MLIKQKISHWDSKTIQLIASYKIKLSALPLAQTPHGFHYEVCLATPK